MGRRHICYNSSSTEKDKLTGKFHSKSCSTIRLTSAVPCTFTHALAYILAPALNFVSGLSSIYINMSLQ